MVTDSVLVLCGGLDRSETQLCLGLTEAGFVVTVVGSPEEHTSARLRSGGVAVVPMQWRGRLDPSAIWRVRRLLRRCAGSRAILHAFTNNAVSNAIFASLGSKARVVAYRGTMGHVSPWDPSSWMTYLNPRLNAIVANSYAVASYLRAVGVREDKVVTIYKGHSLDWYRYDPSGVRSELALDERHILIGCAAAIRPVKGVDRLIEAFSLLDDLPHVYLLLIGENRDPVVAKQLASAQARRVIHVGHKTDAPRYLAACDLVALTSREREGFPRAVIEAMAQGVPVLVSGVGGMPEMVDDGVSGRVVYDVAPDKLAAAIRDAVSDVERLRRWGKAAKQKVADKFSITTTIQETIVLYRRLLGD